MVQTKQEAPYKPPVLFLGGSYRVRLSRAWAKKRGYPKATSSVMRVERLKRSLLSLPLP